MLTCTYSTRLQCQLTESAEIALSCSRKYDFKNGPVVTLLGIGQNQCKLLNTAIIRPRDGVMADEGHCSKKGHGSAARH